MNNLPGIGTGIALILYILIRDVLPWIRNRKAIRYTGNPGESGSTEGRIRSLEGQISEARFALLERRMDVIERRLDVIESKK